MSAINPDAHSKKGIDHISYGVRIARKAKFEKERILNTKSAGELIEWFQNHR
jgi:DNA polymerase (family 10)